MLTRSRNVWLQIYFSYGTRPASLLFLYNGFVPNELSPRDRIK